MLWEKVYNEANLEQGTLFGIFVIYTAITVCSMVGVVIIEGMLAKKAEQKVLESEGLGDENTNIKGWANNSKIMDQSNLKANQSPKFK